MMQDDTEHQAACVKVHASYGKRANRAAQSSAWI